MRVPTGDTAADTSAEPLISFQEWRMINRRKYRSERQGKALAVIIVALLGIALLHVPACAHKVNVFAYVEGDSVVVEGYFNKDAKAQNCSVEVLDEGGKKIHEGKTDDKGMYAFKLAELPAFTGSLKIVLEAGMGHKADYTLSADDIPGAEKKEAQPQAQPPEQARENKPEQDASAARPAVSSSVPGIDQAALMAALETVMEQKLAPIARMLGKQEKLLLEEKFGGPKMTDIIGGIGWIVGMLGLAAFFKGRNRDHTK
jgi:nickel transport protein